MELLKLLVQTKIRKYNIMLLALDVDGVILNFDSFYSKFAYEKFGVRIQDKTAWNMNQRYGLSDSQDKEVWRMINESNWTGLPFFDDTKQAVKIINQLQSKHGSDLEVIFVSSFNQKYFNGRFHDLQCAGFNINKHQLIACGSHAGNKSKLDFIKAENIDWFVDDRVTNLYDVSPISKHLIHVNRGYSENGDNEKIQMMKQRSKFHSVNGLLDFVENILLDYILDR